jgi:hypothetical protein
MGKKYKDEKRIMFRNKEKMTAKVIELKEKGCKIIKCGYICERGYRNFGWNYGIIFQELTHPA